MSTSPDQTAPEPPASKPPSAAGRYFFVFLLGLVLGVVAVVVLLRALDARKTWQDRYPHATMHLLSAHAAQLGANVDANRCSPTDTLPHLQALRSLGNDLEPAFAGLSDDSRFVAHAGKFRATVDAALASPPLNCPGAKATVDKLGESCRNCHQDFHG